MDALTLILVANAMLIFVLVFAMDD